LSKWSNWLVLRRVRTAAFVWPVISNASVTTPAAASTRVLFRFMVVLSSQCISGRGSASAYESAVARRLSLLLHLAVFDEHVAEVEVQVAVPGFGDDVLGTVLPQAYGKSKTLRRILRSD